MRTANSEQRTANSEQRTANSEQPNHSPKLRVLYVTNDDGCGGGASFAVTTLMLDLMKRYNVELVFLAIRESEFTDLCRKNGIEVIVQGYYPWTAGTNKFVTMLKGRVKHLINRFHLSRKIFSLLKDRHFDIIHTNSSITDMGDIIARHYSLPHVWHLRESGNCYYCSSRYVRSRHARATANIVISQSMYAIYVNQLKLCPPENSRIIYDGLEISGPYKKHTPDPKHINFCMTSNLHFIKNQLMAVKACEKLKALTHNFTMHLIGSDKGEYADELKSFVRTHGLEDCVKIWGYRWDIGEILHDMDVGLMLSTREGFGRVTVEYMLNYMPVIGTDTGATPEIVIDCETGYIVPLNDTDKLAEVMHKFIIHPELIPALGSKGRERAVENYQLERNTDEIYALYQEILNR